MIINIQDDILKIHSLGLLDKLLADKTTKGRILWATDAYEERGPEYDRQHEITPGLITGGRSDVIKTRARKELEHRAERTKKHAEVFTPLWVCNKMNNYLDENWFDYAAVFNTEEGPTERVVFPEGKTWKQYVDLRKMEITCGEAPFLITRYDVESGEVIPIRERSGLLDRKLRVASENADSEEEWIKWTIRAFEATYGYEYQGDNLLIARVNLLMTFEEYLQEKWKRKPTKREYEKIINIITWNLWQMDGLTLTVPFSKVDEEEQLSLFAQLQPEEEERKQSPCRIYDWRSAHSSVDYKTMQARIR